MHGYSGLILNDVNTGIIKISALSINVPLELWEEEVTKLLTYDSATSTRGSEWIQFLDFIAVGTELAQAQGINLTY